MQQHNGVLDSRKHGRGELLVAVVGRGDDGERERSHGVLEDERGGVGHRTAGIVHDEEVSGLGESAKVGNLEILGAGGLEQLKDGILTFLGAASGVVLDGLHELESAQSVGDFVRFEADAREGLDGIKAPFVFDLTEALFGDAWLEGVDFENGHVALVKARGSDLDSARH